MKVIRPAMKVTQARCGCLRTPVACCRKIVGIY